MIWRIPDDFFRRYKNEYSQVKGTALHAVASSFINDGFKLNDNRFHRRLITYLIGSKDVAIWDGSKYTCYNLPKRVIDVDSFYYTLMDYVNDGIGYRMRTEQVLYYSDYCFGTADCISYDEKKKFLRIHDLKTGTLPAHMEQLLIYAGIFCLQHNIKPSEISVQLRIYQSGEIEIFDPTVEDLAPAIDKIITANRHITNIKKEEDLS